jgi:hypothetical protein
MFGLKGRQDGFRLLLPKDFLCQEIEEKYAKILRAKKSFYMRPIDFLNETIQKVQVLGFTNATVQQKQSGTGVQFMRMTEDRTKQNEFMFPSTDYNYRSPNSPLDLIDKTLNIEFRHTLGYMNYFMLYENFWYQFARDKTYKELPHNFNIDILNENGSIFAKIVLESPLVNGMDMLDFDYTQPIANSQTFKVEFKFSNIHFDFIEIKEDEEEIVNSSL